MCCVCVVWAGIGWEESFLGGYVFGLFFLPFIAKLVCMYQGLEVSLLGFLKAWVR